MGWPPWPPSLPLTPTCIDDPSGLISRAPHRPRLISENPRHTHTMCYEQSVAATPAPTEPTANTSASQWDSLPMYFPQIQKSHPSVFCPQRHEMAHKVPELRDATSFKGTREIQRERRVGKPVAGPCSPLGSARKDRKHTGGSKGEHGPRGQDNGWAAMPHSRHLALPRGRGGGPGLSWGSPAGEGGQAPGRPWQPERMQARRPINLQP